MDRLPMLLGTVIVLLVVWMFRFETYGPNNSLHRNRITGATCSVAEECWLRPSRN
jgi:hypothetical protein